MCIHHSTEHKVGTDEISAKEMHSWSNGWGDVVLFELYFCCDCFLNNIKNIIGDYWDYYAVKVAQCCKDAL